MKTLRFLFGLVLLLALFGSARPGLAQGTARLDVEFELQKAQEAQEPQEAMGLRLERLARKLDLTGAQTLGWQAAFARHKDGLKKQAEDVRAARQAFRTALGNPDLSPDTLKDMNRALADLRFALIMEIRALRRELRVGLTRDQEQRAGSLERRLMEPGDPDRLTVFSD